VQPGAVEHPIRRVLMIAYAAEMVDDTRKFFVDQGYTLSRRGKPGHLAVENLW